MYDYFRPAINKLAAKYCDVVSYNLYQFSYDRFAPRGLPVDKPVLITESTVGHTARGMFGSLSQSGTGVDARNYALRHQLSSVLKNPQLIGIHHFSFRDQTIIGRWARNGENFCFGLIDVADTPYSDFTSCNRQLAERIYSKRLNPIPPK